MGTIRKYNEPLFLTHSNICEMLADTSFTSFFFPFRLPYLQEGNDLVNFQINEDTSVGSIVYTLKGIDPEGVKVSYTISGDHFSVNRETG